VIPTPELGQVYYYRAQKEIPVGSPPIVIGNNTTYAIYKTAQNKFMLITPKAQNNIDGTVAQHLAQAGELVKKEMAEGKTMQKGILETVLFEAESAIQPSETDPVVAQDVSLDQKVDKYLVRYEREAIPTSAVYDMDAATQANVNAASDTAGAVGTGGPEAPLPPYESRRPKGKGLLESILFEADDDAAGGGPGSGFGGGGDPGADPTGGLGGGDDAGAAPPEPQAPPVIDTPKMNMNSYCRAVARLIENYEALMDPKSTIFNRAKEYVRVNYDEATAKMFEEVMTEQFGVQPKPPERDQRMAPAASNAIYAGGGGGGG
jgi:hypothetical protein